MIARYLIAALVILLFAVPLAGCDDDSPVQPTPVDVAVIRVVDETFRIALPTPELVDAARAAMAGTGPTIPNGVIVSGTGVNVGYSWHLENVEFVDVTIELCDGLPSAVEDEGTDFANGRYCPWSAEVVEIIPG